MSAVLCQTLLDLGDAVSKNLSLSYGCDISYGEETITESCLLELWRRHSAIVDIRTFCKRQEAKNGADWEWHLIGKVYTLRMRVQAKRLAKKHVRFRSLFSYQAKSAVHPQVETLIRGAKAQKLMPVLCFYTSEASRTRWKASPATHNKQPGCLLGSAERIKASGNIDLASLERLLVPWHWLACPSQPSNAFPSVQFLNTGGPSKLPAPLPDYIVPSATAGRLDGEVMSFQLAQELGVMGRITIDISG